MLRVGSSRSPALQESQALLRRRWTTQVSFAVQLTSVFAELSDSF
jgi:hypothetical protein